MSNTTPASGDSAPPDLAIKDCKSALLYPDRSPLAKEGTGAGKWDFRATWAHVPTQTGPDGKVLNNHTLVVYFHGHHNGVKVDQDGKCVQPDWATPDIFSQFTDCTPLRYKLAQMADAAPTRPIVLATENTSPIDRIKNVAGTFSDPAAFGKYLGECTLRLSKLQKHSNCGANAGTYLPANRISAIERIIVAAHSGGGITVQPVASAKTVHFFPSDLVLLDCLYGHDGGGEAYCTLKKAKGSALGLGNGKDQSRIIITTTGGSTEVSGNALIARLRKVLGLSHTLISYDGVTKRPVLTAQQQKTVTNPDGSTSTVPDFGKLGGGIMEIIHIGDNVPIPSAANVDFIVQAMKNCPVVFIHTNVGHDLNPTVFIPLVVNSVGT